MKTLVLDNNHELVVEKAGKKLRLVVLTGGVENVCRLETAKKLVDFAQNDEPHLFKGHLQLHKAGPVVKIFAKGEMVGEIGRKEVSDWLISD